MQFTPAIATVVAAGKVGTAVKGKADDGESTDEGATTRAVGAGPRLQVVNGRNAKATEGITPRQGVLQVW